jgi:hypothetical protein
VFVTLKTFSRHAGVWLGLGLIAALSRPTAAGASPSPAGFDKTIAPLLSRYCYGCHGNGKHKGDVRLDAWQDETALLADRETWKRVLQVVQNHEMPPEKKPQPSAKERGQIAQWIDRAVFHCDCERPDPGRVTLRRLNRTEYNNTIRDLLGVDFKPAEDFPVDDSGYGFDNIGDALSMPPVLIEKYLAAAQSALDIALGSGEAAKVTLKRYPVDALEVGYNAKQHGDGWVSLNSIEEDDVVAKFKVTAPGEYAWRVHAYARQNGTNPIMLTFMRGNRPVEMVEVETNKADPKVYEPRAKLEAGAHRLRAVVRRNKDGLSEAKALEWKTGKDQKGTVLVEWLEVEGPLMPPSLQETRRRIFSRAPERGKESQAARAILESFAKRAYRRPATPREVDRLATLAEGAWKRGESFEQGVTIALQAVLVSPHFLFRGELQPEPNNPKAVQLINDYALASRLSYFLWSTMPDERLFALAGRGTLRRNLAGEVKRMLQDPKSRALVENFAGQWLQIRNLNLVSPDREKYKDFDESLRTAMRRETEMLFETIQREDHSVLEFLSADYTFVNERLARHYGIPFAANSAEEKGKAKLAGEKGRKGEREKLTPAPSLPFSPAAATGAGHGADADHDGWRRVSLRGTPRRGVLAQASVLTLTSNPTRTSPVKRGKWVLENLLNAPPPPPPPNVPELKEGKELKGSLRERMEQHRADSLCASCHARMDPIGFSLEHFDGIGAWREKDGEATIDDSGALVTGEAFVGASGLTDLLLKSKKDQFVRCLADRMLTYALGRGLEYYDKCALDEITTGLAKKDYKFSALVLEIVRSTPFQKRRGDAATPAPDTASR